MLTPGTNCLRLGSDVLRSAPNLQQASTAERTADDIENCGPELSMRDSCSQERGLDTDSGLQRSVDGALLRNFKQLRSLLRTQWACQFQFAFDAIENAFLRFACGAIFSVNPGMTQAYDDALQRPILPSGIHPYCHGRARAQCREQQVVWSWSGICAARSNRFVRGERMRAGNNFLRKAHTVAAYDHARLPD
jgi:hypothetical protein